MEAINWEAISAMSEVIGIIVVVASLIFVGFQLRQTTRTMRAAAAWESENTWAHVNWDMTKDPQLAQFVGRLFNNQEFNEGEMVQVHLLVRSVLQHIQGQYYLNKDGGLSGENWERRLNWMRQLASLPVVRAIIKQELAQGILSPEFLRLITQKADNPNVSVGRELVQDD